MTTKLTSTMFLMPNSTRDSGLRISFCDRDDAGSQGFGIDIDDATYEIKTLPELQAFHRLLDETWHHWVAVENQSKIRVVAAKAPGGRRRWQPVYIDGTPAFSEDLGINMDQSGYSTRRGAEEAAKALRGES